MVLGAGVLLSACGGGSGGAASPGVTTKSLNGVVGGRPGALTFGGSPLVISGPVTVNGKSATATSVQPGSLIKATQTVGAAKAAGPVQVTAVNVDVQIMGAIQQLDTAAATLQVLGQLIHLNALTEIAQVAADGSSVNLTLGNLAVGDFVEVSGTPNADGSVLATRIEREKAPAAGQPAPSVEIQGSVGNFDATAKTFSIGTQLVDYSAALVAGTVQNGASVEVEGTLNGTTLSASQVKVETADATLAGEVVEVEGLVQDLDQTAHRFRVADFNVDFATLAPVTGLANSASVHVEGQVDAADPALIHASQIKVEQDHAGSGAADGDVHGAVTAVDATQSTLTVGNAGFFVDAGTVIESNDAAIQLGDIKVGDQVQIEFNDQRTQGGLPYATKIEVDPAGSSAGASATPAAQADGKIADFNAAATTFSVDGTPVQVDANTVYESLDQQLTQAEFFGTDRTGQAVEVEGTPGTGGAIVAGKIQLKTH